MDAERASRFGTTLRGLDGVKRVVRQADDDGPHGFVFVAQRAAITLVLGLTLVVLVAGALVVLVVNVGLPIVSGSLTLLFQRWLAGRSGAGWSRTA